MTQQAETRASTVSFLHSIRFQLLLISLALLLIPWGGYRYLQEMELFLRQAQTQRLVQAAESAAVAVRYQADLFAVGGDFDASSQFDPGILLHSLATEVQLDGYDEEWRPYHPDRRSYRSAGDLALDLLAGVRGSYLYLLLDVSDDHLLAWRAQPGTDLPGDSIELALEHLDGGFGRYRVSPASPGWVTTFQRHTGGHWRPEPRIRGELQQHASGYRVELRIPRYLVGERMAVGVVDVDDPDTRAVSARLQSAPLGSLRHLGRLIPERDALAAAIAPLVQPGMRIWIVDRAGRVLATRGDLQSGEDMSSRGTGNLLQSLVRLTIRSALGHPGSAIDDDLAGRRRISTPVLARVLHGETATNRRQASVSHAVIESIARPVSSPDGIIGAVLVEQSSSEILTLQSEAAQRLLVYSLLLIAGVALLLLGFATMLVVRIRRLRDRLEAAVSSEGRIRGELARTRAKDEIGDLQRSFGSVMARLREYNAYLEAMASRLAHELKTPLGIARSSLDNMELLEPRPEQRTYIERAQQGLRRLSLIIDRMREASRLEQSIECAERKPTDLEPTLAALVEGYSAVHSGQRFGYESGGGPLRANVDVDLICQALEKLLANALDFHEPGSEILLRSGQEDGGISIQVINRGPPLSEALQRRLFQAMVTERAERGDEPHLGLGLYLVRLIAEFHGGGITAHNLADGGGVVFELGLPAA